MREIAITRQYKKDIERLLKQGKNMAKLNEVVKKLAADSRLAARYHDHRLTVGMEVLPRMLY